MILDPKIQITEVSLQGTLHAIVPTTNNSAPARLDRALRQMEREYGLKLTFTPDKAKTDPGYPEHHNCKCHTEIDTSLGDDLPKCTASEHTKEIFLRAIDKYPNTGHEDASEFWLDVSINKRINKTIYYYSNCPFCEESIFGYGCTDKIKKNKNPLQRFIENVGQTVRLCPQCQISFQWDFDKNTVIMKNERSE